MHVYSDCMALSVEMDTYLHSHRFVMPTAVSEQNGRMTLPENVEPTVHPTTSWVKDQLISFLDAYITETKHCPNHRLAAFSSEFFRHNLRE